MASVNPRVEALDITLVNTSATDIQFQVVGQTETRMLDQGEEVNLAELRMPTHIRLAQEDGGLARAEIKTIMSEEGLLSIELSEAEIPSEEVRSILVLETCVVYLL